MNNQRLYEAMGNIDEKRIQAAHAPTPKKKPIWIKWGAMTACLALLVGVGIPAWIRLTATEHPTPPSGSESMGAAAPAYADLAIYYVDNGGISFEKMYLRQSPETAFEAWKEKNGIGAEVVLVDVSIESNGSTGTETQNGQSAATHETGDHFALRVTVSQNIEHYYDDLEKELLLQTLEKTMRGCINITFDDYSLLLE